MLEVLLQFRHRRFRRDLSDYLDNMLPERARRRLEAHLDACQACRQELAELRSTVEALGGLPMAEVPRSFALAAAPLAEAGRRPAVRRLEFGLRLATATAAFALALVVIGDIAGLPGGGKEEKELAAPVPAAEERAQGGQGEQGLLGVTPAATGTPAPTEAAPAETPAVAGVVPQETPEPPGIAEIPGAPEDQARQKEATQAPQVGEEGQPYAADHETVAEEGGGLSREDVVRWLEVGLGAGTGALVLVWAFVRFEKRTGNGP
jgi:anti-sigma factor RsiW